MNDLIVQLVLRMLAILLLFGYAALVGIWLFPPWWASYVLMGSHMLLSLRLWRRLHLQSSAKTPFRITEIGVSLVAVIGIILPVLFAHQGRHLVIDGGATPTINAHFYTLD